MATIGSLAVAFTANLKGLEDGIEEVVDLFDDLSEAAEDLTEKLSTVSQARVAINVDSSGLEKARSDVESLQKAASTTATIKAAAETSSVDAATTSVEKLGDAIESTTEAATSSRNSISQAVITAARLSAAATATASAYREVRDGTLAYIASATRARSTSEQLAVVNAALRGDYIALRVVMAGVGRSIQGYVAGFFTAEGAANVLRAGLSGLLSALGVTDQALASSIKYFADFSITQAASAAAYRLSQRSLAVLGESLDVAGEAAARFAASSATLRSAGATVATAFNAANNAFNVTSARISLVLSRLNVAGPVSATVGTAFDSLRQTVEELASGSKTLSSVASSVSAGLASLIPSSVAVSSALTRAASTASGLVGTFGTLLSSLQFIREGANSTAEGFIGLVARTAATSAAIGGVAGALGAWAAGTSVVAGATASAGAALASFATALPVTAGLAIAAAVATGRFARELESLSVQSQQVEQMADRFGAPRQEIEKLRLSASNAGVGLSQLAKAQQAFYTSLGKIKAGQLNVENVREAKLAFDRLGISLDEIRGKSPDQVFKTVAAELSKVEDPAKRTQIAFDLFGKQGAAILPALKEFGELSADFDRLGGSISNLDFSRFTSLEQSFDRLHASASSLRTAMLVPFTELQKAFNNAMADIKGGVATALGPIASVLADATKPFAVVIEVAGRFVGILLRIVGVFTTIAASLSVLGTIAQLFEGIQQGVYAAMEPVEQLISMLQGVAGLISSYMRPLSGIFTAIGAAIGVVVGGLAQLVTYVALGAAAWGVYSAAVAVATGFSLVATVQFIAMWIAALGPFALVVAGLAAIGAGIAAVTYLVAAGIKWLYDFADSFGVFGESQPEINAATASVSELANAAARSADGVDKIAASVEAARGGIGDLTIEAAKFGDAGADAAKAAQEQFGELQQKLAQKKIDLPTFDKESAKIRENLEKNLEILRDDSPEITLKKNLELYKQLDDAAKQAAKSTRDIGADVQIGDKIFPRSEEVKARAKQFEREYTAALEAIKKKQQSGDFARELTAKKKQNEDDFKSGRINKEQFESVKIELDSTTAQEQAAIAAEDAQREFQRKKVKLEADLSFADGIRKSLETAFLTPVEKFQKELKKIRDNPELTASEKDQAESNLRREAREGLIGKTAQTQLQERKRDLDQGVESGLISREQADFQGKKALDDLAQALGVVKTPFEEFSTSLDGIAEKFGFVGQPLDEVRKQLQGTPEQLALFDRAVKESRDKLLASLGVEKSPEQVFQEQMKKIEEAANSSDPNKRITAEQRQQAETAARRQRDKALGVGDGLGEQFAERQANINEAFGGGKDNARLAIANNALAADKRAAAGLDADPAQQLKAGAAKIDDVFKVTGKSLAEIQATLSPEDFALYQEAQKKNTENIKASLGVEKSGAAQFAEARQKLTKAVTDGVISQDEANKVLKNQKDALLQSLGISKSPSQDFEDAVAKIRENASELTPDELQKGLKEAKDKLLQSLGIDKSPADAAEESLKKLREAFNKGQISLDEFNKGTQKAKDALLQSLGIPLDPVVQLGDRLGDLQEAFGKGLITQEEFTRGQEEARRAMLPGGEAESPVKKFERDLDAVDRALQEGLIDPADADQRKKVLQAQLQEDLKPALDRVAPDRRAVESADTRSKAGVDTFFRILRGQDNPGLKAQLETAQATKFLAQAAAQPEAAEVIAQLAAR